MFEMRGKHPMFPKSENLKLLNFQIVAMRGKHSRFRTSENVKGLGKTLSSFNNDRNSGFPKSGANT